MAFIEVEIDLSPIMNKLNTLRRPGLDQAVAMALADTQKNTKTKAASAIAKHMGVPSSSVKEKITTPHVPVGAYIATVRSSRRPIPLIDFKVRQTSTGVSTRAWGKSQVIRHAFIATMRSGHRGVFWRTGKSRTPIRELWGPTIAGTFATPEVAALIRQTMTQRLPTNLARRIRQAERQAKK